MFPSQRLNSLFAYAPLYCDAEMMQSRTVPDGKVDACGVECVHARRIGLRFERECESLNGIRMVRQIEAASVLRTSARRKSEQED